MPRNRRTALLAAVVVLAAVVLVVALAGGGQDDRAASGPARATEQPPPEAGDTDPADPGEALARARRATLEAGGRSLLPARDGALEAVAGRTAEGRGLLVTDVTKLGFFAGTSALDRVFVLWDEDPPVVMTLVDVEGTVERAPDDPGAGLVLGPADAAVVAAHGGYVEATEVAPAD